MTKEEAKEAIKEAYGSSEYTYEIIKALEQVSTTKNDLGTDCISREKALGVIRNLYPSMSRVDFNRSLRKWADKYKCEDAIKELSPVTLIRPKGHWREVDTNMYACSKCSHVLTIDPLDNSILGMNTCPFCSAEMEGVVDDKGRSKTLVRNRIETVGR